MNGQYKEYELGAVCSRLSSGKGISAKNIFENGKYPVFGGNGQRGFTNCMNFDGRCAIIGRQGAFCGNVRYFSGQAYMTEHAIVLCANCENCTEYLYYLLSTMELGRLSGQSAQPGLSVKVLAKQRIFLPNLTVQKKVAHVLRTIDEKIESNTQINHNLEEQAKAIFKSWFVELEPFGGVVPDNWQKERLKKILSLQKRPIKAGDSKELPYLPIDSIPMRTFAITDARPNSEAQSSLLLFDKDDILIGAMRVYFHRVIIAPFDGITRTTCFVLKPNDPAYLSFSLLTCDLDSSINFAQKTSKGSTMPYAVWDGGMGEIDILLPPSNIAMEFNAIVLPMLRKIQESYREVYSLQKLRDTLLPKLMSGEIDVSEVEV